MRARHGSQWSAIQSIATQIGCSGETLRNWVRQSERDQACVLARRRTSASGSRRSNGRTASYAKPTRSCQGERIFAFAELDRRSGHDQFHRRSSGSLRGRLREPQMRPICRTLPIARRPTTRMPPARRSDKQPVRARSDAALMIEIKRVFEANFCVYGVRKVWQQLAREGIVTARCTVAWLMRRLGLAGVVRGRTRAHHDRRSGRCLPPRPRVNRQFKAPTAEALWVTTYLRGDVVGLRLCGVRHRCVRRRIPCPASPARTGSGWRAHAALTRASCGML